MRSKKLIGYCSTALSVANGYSAAIAYDQGDMWRVIVSLNLFVLISVLSGFVLKMYEDSE